MRTLAIVVVIASGCGSRADVPPAAPQHSDRPLATAAESADGAPSASPEPAPSEPRAAAGAPEDEPRPITPMDRNIEWRLAASSTRLTMAECARWRLRLVATNRGTETVAPMAGHPSTIAVDGVPSMQADLAFSNGVLEPGWMELAPGASVSTERALGESLFERPGTYRLTLTHGDATSELTVVVRP